MVSQRSSRRWKGHSSSRGTWTGWKRCTNAACGTFNCFTSETTWCRRWATRTQPPAHLGGLTAFGAEVVKECNRLGIVVDLAHASHETVLGALKVATQPLIVSHTCLDSRTGGNPRMAEMMKPRLISKEHAKVVADAGGVIGVWTHLADSLKDFVESIKAMVDAVGIDHVGYRQRHGSALLAGWPRHQQGVAGPDWRIFPRGCRRDAAPGLHA